MNRNPKINVKSDNFCNHFKFSQSENCLINTHQYIQNLIYFNFSQSMLLELKSLIVLLLKNGIISWVDYRSIYSSVRLLFLCMLTSVYALGRNTLNPLQWFCFLPDYLYDAGLDT